MIKKKNIIYALFLLFGIILFVHQIVSTGPENILNAIIEFSLLNFIFFLSISAFNFFLYSLRWQLILKALNPNKKISTIACYFDRMAAFAVSYVTPTAQLGGEPLRVLLVEEQGVSRRKAIQSIIIDKALEVSAMVLFISAGIIITLFEPNLPNESKILFGIIGILMLGGISTFYYCSYKQIGFFTSLLKILGLWKLKKLKKFKQSTHEFEKEMNSFYSSHAFLFNKLLVISLFTVAFILIEHFTVAYFLNLQMNFLQTFSVSAIPYLAYLMPVPAGIGVLESSTAAIFSFQGLVINSFAFIFIIRLRDFVFVLIGLARGSQKGLLIMKKEYKKDFQ